MTTDNTSTIADTSSDIKHPVAHAHKPKSGGVVFLLLFSISVVCGGFYWLWKNDEATKRENAKWRETINLRFDSAQSEQEKASQAVKQEFEAIETKITDVSNRFSDTGRDLLIAEISYILQIANYRLRLDQDYKTTLFALKLADNKLRAITDPAFLETRQALAKDIATLENLTLPDFTGISLALGEIATHVTNISIKHPKLDQNTTPSDELTTTTEDSLWQQTINKIWSALKSLFVIRHRDTNVEPLVSPQQAEYISLNLQLKLEQTRLALAQRNNALFHSHLKSIQDWIVKYYDTDLEPAKNLLEKMTVWQNIDIAPELPDISTSTRSLEKAAKKAGFALVTNMFFGDTTAAGGKAR